MDRNRLNHKLLRGDARGFGEPPAIPGPAAVVNAIAAAIGVRVMTLPVDTEALVADGS